jgi:hypothetical protein
VISLPVQLSVIHFQVDWASVKCLGYLRKG